MAIKRDWVWAIITSYRRLIKINATAIKGLSLSRMGCLQGFCENGHVHIHMIMINKGILEGQNQKFLQMLDHAASMCDGHMRRSEGKGPLLRQFNSKLNKLSYFPVNPTSKWKGGTGEWKSCENIFQLAWIISYTRLFVFTTFQSTAAPHRRAARAKGTVEKPYWGLQGKTKGAKKRDGWRTWGYNDAHSI